MSDKPTESHSEVVAKPQKGGFKRHCARFWWIYLIAFIVIAVLAVVLIIFVAVPKIAQKKLDQAKLTIEGIVVTRTESSKYNMAINSTIHADDSVHATISSFTGNMYLEDLEGHTPFAAIEFPQTSAQTLQTVNVSQIISIDNMEAFTTFNTWLLANKTVRVTVEGKPTIHVKGLSKGYGATFKKTIELDGLDNFSGLNLTYGTLSVLPDENGDNFRGFVDIPNHSVLTLEIGNASFSTSFDGGNLGVTILDNMILYPGINNITMHANMAQLPVLKAINEEPYCETGIMPFVLTGINVTNNGQNLTYYGDALAAVSQTVNIDIGSILARDLNITANCSASTR